MIVRFDAHSALHSLYWMELDAEVEPATTSETHVISVFNPRPTERI
jgi:hypothetical protein